MAPAALDWQKKNSCDPQYKIYELKLLMHNLKVSLDQKELTAIHCLDYHLLDTMTLLAMQNVLDEIKSGLLPLENQQLSNVWRLNQNSCE